MAKKDHLDAARKCLIELRAGTPRARNLVEQMRNHLLESGAALSDLGVTKEDVFLMMEKGAKLRAEKLVRELREDGRDKADFAELIRESVAEAGVTLEDVGTSEDELKKLA